MRAPLISIRAVQPVVSGLQELGYPTQDILHSAGIDPLVLRDVEGRISGQVMGELWRCAQETTGDEYLGLHLAEAALVGAFEVYSYAMVSSATLRAAYRRACRYQRLIHETNYLVFEEHHGTGILRHARPGGRPVGRHPAEFLTTLWVRFGRLVTDTDWSPELVCFAHEAPPQCDEHQRIFRCPVQFSTGRTEMHVLNETLDIRNPNADRVLVDLLDRYANDLLERAPSGVTMSDRVRRWLIGEMSGGKLTVSAAASAMHVSERTLHRHLQDEGTNFRQLLDQLRLEQATKLLSNPRCSLAEVAFLLGFSESSSFHRAFKRWTGQTPAGYRAALT